MTENDRKRFAELLSSLAQIFSMPLSERDLESYWQFLRDYPLPQIQQAVIHFCASPEGHRFMPKPGEIVAFLLGKKDDQSLLAWIKVTKAIRQVGGGKTVVFDDPVIHAVISDLGGWIRLCQYTEREMGFQRREVERLYACYLSRPIKNYPRQLAGLFDRVNASGGYPLRQKPILLGDLAKAVLVYKNGNKDSALPAKALSIRQIVALGMAFATQKIGCDTQIQVDRSKENLEG